MLFPLIGDLPCSYVPNHTDNWEILYVDGSSLSLPVNGTTQPQQQPTQPSWPTRPDIFTEGRFWLEVALRTCPLPSAFHSNMLERFKQFIFSACKQVNCSPLALRRANSRIEALHHCRDFYSDQSQQRCNLLSLALDQLPGLLSGLLDFVFRLWLRRLPEDVQTVARLHQSGASEPLLQLVQRRLEHHLHMTAQQIVMVLGSNFNFDSIFNLVKGFETKIGGQRAAVTIAVACMSCSSLPAELESRGVSPELIGTKAFDLSLLSPPALPFSDALIAGLVRTYDEALAGLADPTALTTANQYAALVEKVKADDHLNRALPLLHGSPDCASVLRLFAADLLVQLCGLDKIGSEVSSLLCDTLCSAVDHQSALRTSAALYAFFICQIHKQLLLDLSTLLQTCALQAPLTDAPLDSPDCVKRILGAAVSQCFSGLEVALKSSDPLPLLRAWAGRALTVLQPRWRSEADLNTLWQLQQFGIAAYFFASFPDPAERDVVALQGLLGIRGNGLGGALPIISECAAVLYRQDRGCVASFMDSCLGLFLPACEVGPSGQPCLPQQDLYSMLFGGNFDPLLHAAAGVQESTPRDWRPDFLSPTVRRTLFAVCSAFVTLTPVQQKEPPTALSGFEERCNKLLEKKLSDEDAVFFPAMMRKLALAEQQSNVTQRSPALLFFQAETGQCLCSIHFF